MSKKPPPLDPLALTRPEHATNKSQGMETVNRIKACGGCFCCHRRNRATEGWGRANCGMVKPAEFLKPGCQFDPDFDRIYSPENVE